MNPTHKRLAEIKQRCEAATEGPWTFTPADKCDDWTLYNSEFTFVKQDDSGVPVNKEDGEFIAHARSDVPCLLEALSVALEGLELSAIQKSDLPCFDEARKALAKIERIMGGVK